MGLARWVYLTTLNVLNRSLRADLFVARFPLLGVLFLACSSHQKVDGLPPHSLTACSNAFLNLGPYASININTPSLVSWCLPKK